MTTHLVINVFKLRKFLFLPGNLQNSALGHKIGSTNTLRTKRNMVPNGKLGGYSALSSVYMKNIILFNVKTLKIHCMAMWKQLNEKLQYHCLCFMSPFEVDPVIQLGGGQHNIKCARKHFLIMLYSTLLTDASRLRCDYKLLLTCDPYQKVPVGAWKCVISYWRSYFFQWEILCFKIQIYMKISSWMSFGADLTMYTEVQQLPFRETSKSDDT